MKKIVYGSNKKSAYFIIYICALFVVPKCKKYIDIRINLYINLIIYSLLFFIAIIFFREMLKNDFIKIIRNKKQFCSNLSLSIALGLVALIAQIILAIAVSRIVPQNTNQELSNQNLYSNFYLTFIISVILVPFVEEIVFKYLIFKSIYKKNRIIAYIITGVCFGLLH